MNWLMIFPFFPLLSFLFLILFGARCKWWLNASISVGSVFASAAVVAWIIVVLDTSQSAYTIVLWQWINLGSTQIDIAFSFDPLAKVMLGVVTGVGALIHFYAAFYMREDKHFSRFMAYMNLFIVAMLMLVLADNLVLLYLGWEGVGLCSFLLIGFWYQSADNVKAAKKAFIVTRVGDALMAAGLVWLYNQTGSLTLTDIVNSIELLSPEMHEALFWIGLLLLGGAVGKSAQLPLQTWLPDAMAGPTPVSALIHAATMVTAGVYLIARLHPLYMQVPELMTLIAWVGALTLLLAGCCALAQTDIKRVLAYSTMSQIGYMFLALGAGAFNAAIFHLMTHAFFKALLFLAAGSLIAMLHHEQNILRMGGMLKRAPLVSVLFIIGLLALIAFPGSAGFMSKEAIIAELWYSSTAGPIFWWLAITGAFITALYSFRLLFIVFLGEYRGDQHQLTPLPAFSNVTLLILAALSIVGGWWAVEIPFGQLASSNAGDQVWQHWFALSVPWLSFVLALYLFVQSVNGRKQLQTQARFNFGQPLYKLSNAAMGFDALYHWLFVSPISWLAKLNRRDAVDKLIALIAEFFDSWHELFSASQTGNLRWYATTLGVGAVLLIGVALI